MQMLSLWSNSFNMAHWGLMELNSWIHKGYLIHLNKNSVISVKISDAAVRESADLIASFLIKIKKVCLFSICVSLFYRQRLKCDSKWGLAPGGHPYQLQSAHKDSHTHRHQTHTNVGMQIMEKCNTSTPSILISICIIQIQLCKYIL